MVDGSRRGRLLAMKLAALVHEHQGGTALQAEPISLGAAAVDGSVGWVLLDERPHRGLGPALAWALRSGVDRLHLLAEAGTGVLARRAAAFRLPISVWHVADRTLLPAIAEPLPEHPPVPAAHEQFRSLIIEGGATPWIEHGVLIGEVRGLEVCRVVTDRTTGDTRLEVGVGQHDREAFQMLHGDVPPVAALAAVVAAVVPHRRPGADPHPLNRIGQEHALRARLIDSPSLIGASRVDAAQSPLARTNLKAPSPSVATAIINGAPTTLVISTGVDLDLVPFAIDARLAMGGPARIVVPARDAVTIQSEIAALLHEPIPIVPVE